MSKGKVIIAKTVNQPEVTDINPKIQSLIDIGIPLQMAIFHDTVRSFEGNGTPEYQYYHQNKDTHKTSRIAKLWYTPHGVVMEKLGKYKLIPLAALKDSFVL